MPLKEMLAYPVLSKSGSRNWTVARGLSSLKTPFCDMQRSKAAGASLLAGPSTEEISSNPFNPGRLN